jgi:hypothetical protein
MKLAACLKRLPAGLAAAALAACVSLEQAAPPVETRCATCHSVEPVRKYSRAHWEREILPEMAEETNLSASDAAAVRAYVLAVLDSPEMSAGR